MLAAIPLLVLPVGAYAALALILTGGFFALDAPERLSRPLLVLSTAGGGSWPVSSADLLLGVAIVISFLELLKGVADRRAAIVNHALSIILFIACLAAMLVAPVFATSTFFLLTLMVLLDLIAGFVITMGQAGGGAAPRA